MQMPKNGRPARITLVTDWRSAPPPPSSPAAHAPNAPWPGTTSLSARATVSASALIETRAPDGRQRLLDAAQVSASQVGDDDRGRAHEVSVPLVDGTPTTRGSRRTAAAVARANALNSASIMWWAFSP